MIITIFGSRHQEDEIKNAEKFLVDICKNDEEVVIRTPFDKSYSNMPLVSKRDACIDYIKESDLVIIISKGIIPGDGKNFADLHVEIGESVSWEVAIAKHFGKRIVYI